MSESKNNPISVRIDPKIVVKIKEDTGQSSFAGAILFLYEFFKENKKEGSEEDQKLRELESQIEELKSSPLDFDPNEIKELMDVLNQKKAEIKAIKANELRNQIMKLVK